MDPRATSGTNRTNLDVDSGYISDALDAQPSDVKRAIAQSESFPPEPVFNITTVKFANTNQDVPVSELVDSATVPLSPEHVKGLKIPAKLSKRFPIIPLESTLARAREEAEESSGTNGSPPAPVQVKTRRTSTKSEPAVVDSHGRTRAAQKALASADPAQRTLSFVASGTASTTNGTDTKKREIGELQLSAPRKLKVAKKDD